MTNTIALTLTHHGVPIGTVVAGPENRFPTRGEDDPRDEVMFVFLPFVPAPGYEALRPAFRLAYRVFKNLGFLGPAADPASDLAGRQAAAAARTLWTEIELRDAHGQIVSGHVITFYEGDEVEAPYWVDIRLGRAFAAVPARTYPRIDPSTDSNPPAT